jgi:hypothetical protein
LEQNLLSIVLPSLQFGQILGFSLSIEYRYEALKREVNFLEFEKRNSARIFQELSDQISDLRHRSHSLSFEEKRQMAEPHQKYIVNYLNQ